MIAIATGTKIRLAFWGLLFVPFLCWAQRPKLTPFKVTIFEDAFQLGQKGIVRFHQGRAEIPMDYEVDASAASVITNGEFQVNWYRFRHDSTLKELPVANWTDVLKANISRSVTIVYEIGRDFDEVDGDVRWINEDENLLLLHGNDDQEYFIPLEQVRQVVVGSISEYELKKAFVQPVLEIQLDKDIPFVPLEMVSVHKGIYWRPVCRIRIVSREKALLQMDALVENQAFDLPEVEVEISPGSILGEGQLSSDAMELGKVALHRGDQLLMNFLTLELDYDASYGCQVPWLGLQVGQRHDMVVRNTMRFQTPSSSKFSCDRYEVMDENNRTIANIDLREIGKEGEILLDLGRENGIKVTHLETEKKREKKAVKIDGETFFKVLVEGRLSLYNTTAKFAQMQLEREIKGNFTSTSGGKVVEGKESGFHVINWRFKLDPGQKRELRYRFETLAPAN